MALRYIQTYTLGAQVTSRYIGADPSPTLQDSEVEKRVVRLVGKVVKEGGLRPRPPKSSIYNHDSRIGTSGNRDPSGSLHYHAYHRPSAPPSLSRSSSNSMDPQRESEDNGGILPPPSSLHVADQPAKQNPSPRREEGRRKWSSKGYMGRTASSTSSSSKWKEGEEARPAQEDNKGSMGLSHSSSSVIMSPSLSFSTGKFALEHSNSPSPQPHRDTASPSMQVSSSTSSYSTSPPFPSLSSSPILRKVSGL